LGLAGAIFSYRVSPTALAWLSPVLVGWLLSLLLVVLSSHQLLGEALQRFGLLRIPEEYHPPPVIERAQRLRQQLAVIEKGA
jgi:membrane glycosyltransferase